MSYGQPESSAAYWDRQAGTLPEAKFAVWSVDPDEYEKTTSRCLAVIYGFLPPDPRRILDVGCGVGRLTIPVGRLYPDATVVGIDFSPRMIDLAAAEKTRSGIENVEFVYGSAARPIPGGPFDAAYSIVVLQHLERHSAEAIVRNVIDHLEPGGIFVFQTVSDLNFEDWGHVPATVVAGWVVDAGLPDPHQLPGLLFPDWLWTVAEKPAA